MQQQKQQNRLMRRMAVYCVLFTIAVMGVMLYYADTKVIAVTDLAQDEVTGTAGSSAAAANDDENRINIDRLSQPSDYFCIPMPEDVKAENVTIENHYMDRELWVTVSPEEMELLQKFYEENSVYGNCENVLDGHFDVEKKRVCLRFALDDVYEYKSIYENNVLSIEFMQPGEVYDQIVVIDPAYGGEDTGAEQDGIYGKDITLDIARALKAKMDKTDIKVYYTRMDDTDPDTDMRLGLAEAVRADMLLRIEVGSADNARTYGTETVCNSRYFIPDFGSVELADLLERQVVTAISGKANGLVEAAEDDAVISGATVPAAAVKVGYLTNSREFTLLQREDYLEKIAEGIYQTIQAAYDAKEGE
jgi:N-acetylmuramoyl-L-alanine amidase